MYNLIFYVPKSHLESVKEALFAQGAGKYEKYDKCCWQVMGQGQFRALAGSSPFLGKQGEVEKVSEYKVEMICADEYIRQVLKALVQAHPYEEPAYSVWPVNEGLFKNK